ncbi:MAG: hypothetical protein ACRCW7_06795 [Cetobacterium sp.]
MQKVIHAIKTLDSLTVAFLDEKKASEELKERAKFLKDGFGEISIEELILVLDEQDLINIISENIELAKKLVTSLEEEQANGDN